MAGQAAEEWQGFLECLALVGAEFGGDCFREPVFARAAELAEPLGAGGGELDQHLPLVAGVAAAGDETVGLELGDRLRHRLWPHALGGGEAARRECAAAVETAQHGCVGKRERVLGAEAAHELAEDEAELARSFVGDSPGHRMIVRR